jgi:hypothetical protein
MLNNNDTYINSDSENEENDKKKQSKKKDNIKTFKKMSNEEILDYLKDSILIPKNDWDKLSIGSNISYYKNDGNFVKSGFIKAVYSNDGNDFIKYGTKLNTYYNDKYYKEFTVNTSNIKELYKKIDKSAVIEFKIMNKNILNSINTFMDTISKLENELISINERISKLEDNHVKTIKFIKKLHNIKSIDDVKNL